MTVAELIHKLGEFDPALTVKAYDVDYGYCAITDIRVGSEVVFKTDGQGKLLIGDDKMYVTDHYEPLVIINDPLRTD